MEYIPGIIISSLKSARSATISWAGQRPTLAITLVILVSVILLPLVSAAALMPMVALFHIGDYLESKGLLTVLYAICCQGLILLFLVVIMFLISFVIGVGATVIHSYNLFGIK